MSDEPAPSGEGATGRLVLVGTPIGNLGDLSPRAAAALAAPDIIGCEDTRVTRKLLSHAGISGRRLVAVHEHNEAGEAPKLVAAAFSGATVAVVSDAGMPGISDPGRRLVAAAAEAGVVVEVVPGPSAALAALVVSGLPTDRFCFEGFLPRKGRERADRLLEIAAETRTVVLFESPRRVAATIGDLAGACGDQRPVVVARELTKLHEEVRRGTLGDAMAWLATVEPRGEYALVVGPAPTRSVVVDDDQIDEALRDCMTAGADRKAAVAAVTAALGVTKRRVYEAALRLRNAGGQPGARQ